MHESRDDRVVSSTVKRRLLLEDMIEKIEVAPLQRIEMVFQKILVTP